MKLLRPANDFIRTETGSGIVLLAMVPLALLWANGPWQDSYEAFWTTKAAVGIGEHSISLDIRHWVNDGLMTLFFFVVGLEIKRELTVGELSSFRKAATPALAALGGMVVPAAVFVAFNHQQPQLNGWAIPVATDIAIVLGIIALLGKRVPQSLKTFLLTLAIVDDIGAILVIAFFYTPHGLHFVPLGVACVAFIGIFALRRRENEQSVAILLLSLVAWVAIYESGIHATLTGVVIALLTPTTPRVEFGDAESERFNELSTVEDAADSAALARKTVSTTDWLQHILHPWSSYLVLPLFALANAGVLLDSSSANVFGNSIAIGIICGLLIGKPVGITVATLIATRGFKLHLPEGIRLGQVGLVSILGGVGFTVSLFIVDLAFVDAKLATQAKTAVLSGSIAIGIIGFAILYFALGKSAKTQTN